MKRLIRAIPDRLGWKEGIGPFLLKELPSKTGWSATLDGRPTDVLPGDDVFLTVKVPPGEHQLRLVYHTPGAAAGWVISGVGVVCLTVLAAASGRWRRRTAAA